MSLTSVTFLFFILIFIILYYVFPGGWQWYLILIASLVFYASAGPGYLIYIAMTSAVIFAAGLFLDRRNDLGRQQLAAETDRERKKELKSAITRNRKRIVAIAVVITMGIWGVLKYANFFIGNVNAVGHLFTDADLLQPVKFLLPLGISFYTFNAVGYLVDIYRTKYRAEHNFLKFFTYMSFFPHIIQGPFSRYDRLSSDLFRKHTASFDRLRFGALRMCWGYFEKIIIADKIGTAVRTVFQEYASYSGIHIFFTMILYCIQLYADFQGYMDIVCGLCEMLDIELDENFRQPYFARSIDEFWRRWHLTLGTWFKDYIFYPVSFSKAGQKLGRWARRKWGAKMGKLAPGYFAMLFVWTATGLWHGANWTYVIWGWLNMLAILSTMQFQDYYDRAKARLGIRSQGWAWQTLLVIKTFLLVCVFRFFSYSGDLNDAVQMILHSLTHVRTPGIGGFHGLFAGMNDSGIWLCLAGVAMLLTIDILKEKGYWTKVRTNAPYVVRVLLWFALLFLILFFGGDQNDLTSGFMYAIY